MKFLWEKHRREISIVSGLLVLLWNIRFLAALHTGIEVDEPIYRYAALSVEVYGFPSVRPAFDQPMIPFLYHPPFFLWLLALWFQLWHHTDFLTGRLFNVCASTLFLALLYLFVRSKIGKIEACVTLVLVGSDAWIIFTNQAIYIENTLLILILLAMWAYWRATESTDTKQMLYRYLLAGFLTGCVLVYKQIGGFLILSILLHWLIQRRQASGHLLLLGVVIATFALYLGIMHLVFGSLFDSATLIQIRRTLGDRASPGLTYSPFTGITAAATLYRIFVTTILTLIGGSIVAAVRTFQHLFRGRQGNAIVISWAMGGVVFALSISLKSPHYMILWLVPLYVLITQQGCAWARSHLLWLQRETWIILVTALLLFVNVWSFQARFLHVSGDTLQATDAYINQTLPAQAIVATEDYIGIDIHQQYVNINFVQTPQAVYASHADYLALYWSTTEPLPTSLGAITHYCRPQETFNGFKDHVEICQVNKLALAEIVAKKGTS